MSIRPAGIHEMIDLAKVTDLLINRFSTFRILLEELLSSVVPLFVFSLMLL